jgi:hypothetical protein
VHLIICSGEGEFLKQLLASVHHEKDNARMEAEAAGLEPHIVERLASRFHDLLIPTLHQLASSSNVNVTFCATLPQLQAYLSAYHLKGHSLAHSNCNTEGKPPATMVLVNPIAIHRDTASFSAQGLSRTFAGAIEAASRTKAQLLIVECPSRAPPTAEHVTDGGDDEAMHEAGEYQLEAGEPEIDQQDPWEEQVAILNVTTKSFGAGESGWLGRTVKIRGVVERWCVFERPRT